MDGGGEGWILQRLQASLWILSRHKTKSTNISFLLTTRLHTWGSLAGPSGPIGRINPWFHGPKQAPGNVNRYEMRTLHDMRGWGHDLAAAPGEVGTGSAAVNAGQTVGIGRPSGRAAGQGGRAAGSRGNMIARTKRSAAASDGSIGGRVFLLQAAAGAARVGAVEKEALLLAPCSVRGS